MTLWIYCNPNLHNRIDNKGDEGLKEEPFFTPNTKINNLAMAFKLIIIFPASNNPFLNVVISIELIRNVNTQIFIKRDPIQATVIIDKISMGNFFGFNCHDFSIVSIKCHTHLGAIVM